MSIRRVRYVGLAILAGVLMGTVAYAGSNILNKAQDTVVMHASFFGGGNSPEMAASADKVAVAVVQQIGTARFNTPDGKKPSESEMVHFGSKYVIYRPVILRVTGPIKGEEREIRTHILGGLAEGIRFEVEGTPQVDLGEKVLVMLENRSITGLDEMSHNIRALYHLDDAGVARDRESNEELPTAVLLDRVEKTARGSR